MDPPCAGALFLFTPDAGTHGVEFVLDAFVAAIQMVDALHVGRAVRGQTGQHQRGAGAQVRGHDRGAGQTADSAHHGRMAGDLDVRAHAHQLQHVHEAVLEDAFFHHAGAFGQAHQGHDLGLHVGGEAGVGAGLHVRAAQHALVAGQHAFGALFDGQAHAFQLGDDGFQLGEGAVFEQQLAAGDAGRHQKGAGLDAVGHDGVFRAAQAADALDADGAAAVAFDLRAAGDCMATCGTINLDYRSLYHHFENGCFMADCQAVVEIKNDLIRTMGECRDVTDQYQTGRSAYLRLGQLFMRLFAGLL